MNVLQTLRVGIAAAACVVAPSLYANDITLYPNSPGVSNIAGTTTTSAPGFGNGAFKEASNTKGEIYITPGALFGHAVAFSEIASISYWTNKPVNANPNTPFVDWSLYLYTNRTGTGDTGSFYHSRLTAEPLYVNSQSDPSNTWHQWMTGGAEALKFYDSNRNNNIQGTSTDPTFAMLQAGPYTWTQSGTQNDYRPETILFFSLQTGSDWAAGFMGLVDGLTVTLTNGEVGRVNLEAAPAAIPEPESLALVGLGVVALAAARRRRRVA